MHATRSPSPAATGPSVGERAGLETLAPLLAPLGLEEFLADYFDKKPVHLPGDAGRGQALLSEGRLSGLLRANERLRGRIFSFPFTPPDGAEDLVAAYLDAGYPLIWNAARGASPEVDRIVADLATAFQAQVWPNVYATGTAGAPLGMHFDPHEALIVQCEGEKEWRISSLRASRPLDVPEMRATVGQAVEAASGRALESVFMTFTARPGDVVYIPRGQFHAASTPRRRSLHVTFAIRPLSGYDVAQALCRLALADPLLRDYLPFPIEDLDGTRALASAAEMKRRLKDLLDGPDFPKALAGVSQELMNRSLGGQ